MRAIGTYITPDKLLEEHDTAANGRTLEGRPGGEKGRVASQVQRYPRLARKLFAVVLFFEHDFSFDRKILFL